MPKRQNNLAEWAATAKFNPTQSMWPEDYSGKVNQFGQISSVLVGNGDYEESGRATSSPATILTRPANS
jgi:hypothetical protein